MASEALPVCEVGIIGGTGVYGLQDMANKREVGVISIFSASASLSPRHLPFDLLRTANPSAYPCASSIYPHERTAPFIAFHRSSSTRPSASRRAPSSSVSLTVLASPSWRATTCTTAFSLRRSRTRRTCVPTSHGAFLRAHSLRVYGISDTNWHLMSFTVGVSESISSNAPFPCIRTHPQPNLDLRPQASRREVSVRYAFCIPTTSQSAHRRRSSG